MSSWLLPLALLLMTDAPALPADAPIRLMVEPQGDGVQLRVVGASDRAIDASYALEVASDAAAGGNRTTQRGRAQLRPGVPVTLMTLTLGNIAQGRWTARLRVEPVGAVPYEDMRSNSAN
jgi:hypothetical protein